MSLKTVRKRIAVVAVSALTAGLFSVVSVPVANAAIPAASTLFVASTASNTGAAVNADNDQANLKSIGWIEKTSTNGTAANNGYTLTGGLAGSAVIFPGAKIAFACSNAAEANSDVSFVVTGGTISGVTDNTGGTTTLNGSATELVAVGDNDNTAEALGGVLNVSTSAASGAVVTLSCFVGTGISATAPTAGALAGTWTFTVAATSASGAYSASKSTVTTQAAVAKGTVAAGTNAYDTTDRIANGSVGIIYMELDDAYSVNITSGAVTATATNGATVKVADAASDTGAEAYAATLSFSTLAAATAEMYVYVNQPVANTAGSTTVTLTLDGVTVGTKTLNWNGDIASIQILSSSKTSFTNGALAPCNAATTPAGAAGNIIYVVKDAAGNPVTLSTSPTVTDATGAFIGATIGSGDSATAAHGCARQTSAVGYGVATMIVPATALQGAGSFKLKIANSAAVEFKSNEWKGTVSNGATDKFVASWSSPSFAPGDLATLTIKALDAYGNPMAAGNVNTGLTVSVASGFTAVGSACADTTLMDSAGSISCKYAAGNTEGSYSYSIDLTTATSQDPTVGALAVKLATPVTSNADVLKSIVALIASINKQIQALQKLILKR
jgi:hypothetical protein